MRNLTSKFAQMYLLLKFTFFQNKATFVLFQVALILCGYTHVSDATRTCRESDNLELMRRRAELLVTVSLKKLNEIPEPTSGQRSEIEHRHSSSAPENCDALTEDQKINSGLREVSSCPWDVEQDIDNNRIPSSLPFAKCKCNTCRGDSGSSCEMIWHNTLVLRRVNGTCVDGMQLYEPALQPISVGCVCKPMTTQNRRRRSLGDVLRGLSG